MWRYIVSFFVALIAAGHLFPVKHSSPKPQYLDHKGEPITEAQFNALVSASEQTKARIEGYAAARRREQEEADRKRPAGQPLTAFSFPSNRPGPTVLDAPSAPRARSVPKQPRYGCAEKGSCYGDYSWRTRLPKHHHVRGYTRSDGKYVRGHYRSRR